MRRNATVRSRSAIISLIATNSVYYKKKPTYIITHKITPFTAPIHHCSQQLTLMQSPPLSKSWAGDATENTGHGAAPTRTHHHTGFLGKNEGADAGTGEARCPPLQRLGCHPPHCEWYMRHHGHKAAFGGSTLIKAGTSLMTSSSSEALGPGTH